MTDPPEARQRTPGGSVVIGATIALLTAVVVVSALGDDPGRPAATLGVAATAALLLVYFDHRLMLAVVTATTVGYWAAGYPSGPALAAGPLALFLFGLVSPRRLVYPALAVFVVTVVGGAMVGGTVEFDEVASIVGPSAAAVFAADLLQQRAARSRAEAEAAHYRRHQEMVERQLALARDLHDGLGHSLTAVSLQAAVLERTIDGIPGAAEAAATLAETSRTALAELNALVRSLREEGGDDPGRPELGDIARLAESGRRSGHTVRLRADWRHAEIPTALQEAAYRVVQESLTNAGRHAPASTIAIDVETSPQLVVRVEDSGPAGQTDAPTGAGTGLAGMSERVAATGGRLEYGPTQGGGFVVTATWST
ncbi:MAG: sensor histidine kinase [Acidimicrobiales bacterium]